VHNRHLAARARANGQNCPLCLHIIAVAAAPRRVGGAADASATPARQGVRAASLSAPQKAALRACAAAADKLRSTVDGRRRRAHRRRCRLAACHRGSVRSGGAEGGDRTAQGFSRLQLPHTRRSLVADLAARPAADEDAMAHVLGPERARRAIEACELRTWPARG
jgi:hypothetical protein